MSHSFSRLARLVLALVGVVLFAASPACAAGLPQQAGAAGGMYNWYPLAPGQSVEWVFHYPGHGDAALIAFGVDPANAIKVDVYTDEQWRSLGAGIWPVEPVGRGTPGTLDQWSGSQDLIDSGDLFWEAVTWPEMIFHIQIANASQAPAQYWIAQGGPGAGELAPYAPIPAISPIVPAAAPSTPAPASAGAGQTPSGGAPAQGSQPPQTLPVTGGATLIPLSGAGLALIAAGWRARTIAAWPVLHKG